MSMQDLGSISFLDTPDVNGALVLTSATGLSQGSIVGTAGSIVVTGTSTSIIGIADDPIIPGTSGLVLPKGTSAQRAVAPVAGTTRFNTTIGNTETFDGTSWVPFGQVLQMVTGNIAATTGTSQVPWDNTTPTSGEGISIWSVTFTPLSATSRISIQQTLVVATTTANRTVTTSFFAGSTNVGAGGTFCASANLPYSLALITVYSPGSTATITFSARAGLNGSGTLNVNQTSAGNLGGAAVANYIITEIAS